MNAFDIPLLGSVVLALALVSAAYTMAVAVGAGSGRPQLLPAARLGTFATCAFVALAVLLLAYAFQTHDFRIRYVSRYSDRSMSPGYLLAALWGGQDGSLLWWTFLLSGYTAASLRWFKGRYTTLQPWIIATLMSIFGFFLVLMLFAANPFATHIASAPPDGEGLNPLLQNYWMAIHPPSLYMGFVGWSVPFAVLVAAMITGRLDDGWLKAARPWAMISWTFLSLGLLLGCVWSYEELGWGGYWAWDPVENASFMPWLVGTAYLHSAVVQERYGMLKVWNVFLLMLTFVMTIFGTTLTRSGLIASVHAFASSDIGTYFFVYLGLLIAGCAALLIWRVPKLKAEHHIEALLSREFFFLLNNWVLLGMMVFVVGATTWPLLSELILGEEATVGPGFYNRWMIPFGLALLFLTGAGPLIAWRKATGKNLSRAFLVPVVAAVAMAVLHTVAGGALGLPAIVEATSLDTTLGERLESGAAPIYWVVGAIRAASPVLTTALVAFVIASISQEYARGVRVRMRSKKESALTALGRLVGRAKRRYGGYLVHVGVALMYFGFAGAAYDEQHEAAMRPGNVMEVGGHRIRYEEPRMREDPNKRMVFASMTILDDEGEGGTAVNPAKFIYRTHPEMPTTEVAIRTQPTEDLYVILSTVDPQTSRATVRVIVRPFVAWIWFGGLVLLLGCFVCLWPSTSEVFATDKRRVRRVVVHPAFAAGASVLLLILGGLAVPALVQAQSSSLHAANVEIADPEERALFSNLLCQCGDCQRLPLDSCGCSWADEARTELRLRMDNGETKEQLIRGFRARYGPAAIAMPSDEGLDRALWALPVTGSGIAIGGLVWLGLRWRRRGAELPEGGGDAGDEAEDDLDARLEEELRRFEERP